MNKEEKNCHVLQILVHKIKLYPKCYSYNLSARAFSIKLNLCSDIRKLCHMNLMLMLIAFDGAQEKLVVGKKNKYKNE